ncbi:tyrosine-protein phosphatase non-receptor type 9-like [Bacillus rossius redtenbacheri]|uniref:tyrosine-protein phosphatase non-receptor type 9-like n=1 Tax=Bacillus rossius redtenbacheri TaxID=93214 RepID=UPI002FDD46E5
MGVTLTKNQSDAENYAQLIEETNVAYILEQEHREILEEKVFYSSNVMMKPENWSKNKYFNTFCFDHNRVILPTEDGESDFINASHVDGYNIKGRFLCCQAPLQKTAQDFWEIVFTFQARVIVMLTKTVEKEREACYPYWSPRKRTKVHHGKFIIKTRKIKTFRDHVVTSLRITDDTRASLSVKHFAYTDWPSNSLPQNPSKFLDFVLSVRKAQLMAEFDCKDGNVPPMVVHCSAGLNRTGAFCALDICLSQYNERATIALAPIVRNLRKQRCGCLSLSKYYVFCYLTVLLYAKLVADKIEVPTALTRGPGAGAGNNHAAGAAPAAPAAPGTLRRAAASPPRELTTGLVQPAIRIEQSSAFMPHHAPRA